MSRSENAVFSFDTGFNCSQAVLAAFCEELGLDREKALKVSCGFGGGMREGEVCGAVAGAIMVLGLKYGQSAAGDTGAKEKTYTLVKEFNRRFKEMNNSIICRELLGYDISSEVERKYASENGVFDRVCPELIKVSVEILEDILEQCRN